MTVREILWLGASVLRKPCAPVAEVSAQVVELAEDLRETMYAAEGIGLAAPQVGVSLRVFVYDVREPDIEPGVLVNPRLLESHGAVRESEGCLSIPGLSEIVERAERVVVEGLDLAGQTVRIEADGLLSRCLQHELDHLDGILFLDRVSPLKRKMLLAKWRKMDDGERRTVSAG